jgi:peptide/nickel transport system ATP-binding protein
MSTAALLRVEGLSVDFVTGEATVRAVDEVSFDLPAGGSIGLVGESGCGKSTTAYGIMRLLPGNGRISAGRVLLEGQDLAALPEPALRRLRWQQIAMVFQNAMTALNPVMRIGEQIVAALMLHQAVPRAEALRRAAAIFGRVGLRPDRLMQYPHEFSGGMRQRAMMALALICGPRVLLADEPTTALDVVAQRRVLELLRDLQQEFHLALILISHDIAAVAEACEQIVVMYAGQVVEQGPTRATLARSRHPYTRALASAVPSLYGPAAGALEGLPPDLSQPSTGCRFAPRCPRAEQRCRNEPPPLHQFDGGHSARCHFAQGFSGGDHAVP